MEKDNFKYLDMFSGIGGFKKGISDSNLPFKSIGHSEIDKYADAIYKYHYPESKNYGDATKIDTNDLPDFDLLVGGFPCFTKHTYVESKSGLKYIEHIKINDYVLTHTGSYKKVLNVMAKPYSAKGHEIEFYFINEPTKCTPEHPFYVITADGTSDLKPYWKEAKQLTSDDFVLVPNDDMGYNYEIILYDITKWTKDQVGVQEPNHLMYNNAYWVRLKRNELIDINETVYNLEVEDDNSYTANFVAVHNCQAFSVCGKGKGFEDARGTLIFELFRILRDRQPKYFLFENVKGLLSNKTSIEKDKITELLKTECKNQNYKISNHPPKADWKIFHENMATYIVDENINESNIDNLLEYNKDNDILIALSKDKDYFKYIKSELNKEQKKKERKYYVRTFNIIIQELDELGYNVQWELINSKNHGVPQSRERIYIAGYLRDGCEREVLFNERCSGETDKNREEERKVIIDTGSQGNRVYSTDGTSVCLTGNGGGQGGRTGLYTIPDTQIKPVMSPTNCSRKPQGPRFKKEGEPSFTLTASDQHGVAMVAKVPEATKKGYAEAKEGDSINLTQPSSKTRRGRVGKECAQTLDCACQQYTLVNRRENQEVKTTTPKSYNDYGDKWRDDEVNATLTQNCEASAERNGQKLFDGYRVRRLTPTECERLQGFEDLWTKYGIINDKETEISDTQRYKCCGNAVTTNVVKYIIKEMYEKWM